MYYPKSIPTNWVIVIVSDILSVEKKKQNCDTKGMVKKKIVEFFIKVGGWGQQWTDFPLFFFFFF